MSDKGIINFEIDARKHFEQEEREAWDRYAAAALAEYLVPPKEQDTLPTPVGTPTAIEMAASIADGMLAERRKRWSQS